MKLKDCLITGLPYQRSVSCLFTERTDTFGIISMALGQVEVGGCFSAAHGPPPRPRVTLGADSEIWVCSSVVADRLRLRTEPSPSSVTQSGHPQVVARLLKRDKNRRHFVRLEEVAYSAMCFSSPTDLLGAFVGHFHGLEAT